MTLRLPPGRAGRIWLLRRLAVAAAGREVLEQKRRVLRCRDRAARARARGGPGTSGRPRRRRPRRVVAACGRTRGRAAARAGARIAVPALAEGHCSRGGTRSASCYPDSVGTSPCRTGELPSPAGGSVGARVRGRRRIGRALEAAAPRRRSPGCSTRRATGGVAGDDTTPARDRAPLDPRARAAPSRRSSSPSTRPTGRTRRVCAGGRAPPQRPSRFLDASHRVLSPGVQCLKSPGNAKGTLTHESEAEAHPRRSGGPRPHRCRRRRRGGVRSRPRPREDVRRPILLHLHLDPAREGRPCRPHWRSRRRRRFRRGGGLSRDHDGRCCSPTSSPGRRWRRWRMPRPASPRPGWSRRSSRTRRRRLRPR